MSDVQVKALRGFRGITSAGFREVTKGQTVTISLMFARELVASHKAEIIELAETPKPAKRGEKDVG